MGKGKHTGQKIHENPDLENSIPSTWDIQLLFIVSPMEISILNLIKIVTPVIVHTKQLQTL